MGLRGARAAAGAGAVAALGALPRAGVVAGVVAEVDARAGWIYKT